MHDKEGLEEVSDKQVEYKDPDSSETATGDHSHDGEGEQRVTATSVLTVIAVVSLYSAQLIHVIGPGLLGQSITSVIGGKDKVTWLTLILTMATVLLGPAVSQIADFWGRKWIIVVSSYISVIGCIVIGRSNTMGMAIGGTIIASATYTTQALIHAIPSEVLPRKYRPMAQLAVNLSGGIGSIIGLYSAGALCRTNPSGFRTYFYMAAGIYFLAGSLILVAYHPLPRQLQKLTWREKLRSLDTPAMLLIIVSLTTFCVGLGFSNNPYPWSDAHVLGPFLTGIVTLVALVVYAVWYKKHGLFDHDLFQSRNFAIAGLALAGEGFSFFAANNYFGFQVSFMYGKDLFQTAIIYSVTWYTAILFGILVGLYATKTKRVKGPAVLAFVFFIAFFAAMATTNSSTPISHLWGFPVMIAVGLSLCLNALVVVAQLSIPPHLISTGTGLIIAVRALGSTIGLAVYNAVFNSALNSNVGPKIANAVIPLGLPASSLPDFISNLTLNDQAGLITVPGITPEIIQAGVKGMRAGFSIAFRNVYISAACFAFLAFILCLFIKNPRDQFTAHVDAPLKENRFLHRHHREEAEHA